MDKILVTSLILLTVMGIVYQPEAEAEKNSPEGAVSGLLTIQANSFLANSTLPSPKVTRVIQMMATAYSSTPQQTDDDPFITAAGTWVRDGIVANNLLPFGTKIRIPELYGDRIFTVEDRMHRKKGFYHVDVWFSSYWEAKSFGAKIINIEVLES